MSYVRARFNQPVSPALQSLLTTQLSNRTTLSPGAPKPENSATGVAPMTPVIRIKAELALTAASGKLLGDQTGTVTAVRKEIDKLVNILADDESEKHFNVAARVATCAGYLALISGQQTQEARRLLIDAHKMLQDVHGDKPLAK